MMIVHFLKMRAPSLNLYTVITAGILMACLPKIALGETVFIGSVNVNSYARVDTIQADQGSDVSVSTVRISGSRLENGLTVRQMNSQVDKIEAGRGTRVSVASLNIHNSRIEGRTSFDMSVRVNGVIRTREGADVQIGSFSIGDDRRKNVSSDEGPASVNGVTDDTPVVGVPSDRDKDNENTYPDIPEELQYAYLSQCVYDDPDKGCSKGNEWHEVGTGELENMGLDANDFVDPLTGFKAKLYYNNDTEEYVLAFAGTDQIRDWVSANVPQLVKAHSPQYMKAMALAEDVSASLGDGKQLSFTGHSLGGGLASAASLLTGKKATTFNASYIHTETVINYAKNKMLENLNDKNIEKKLEKLDTMIAKINKNEIKSNDLITSYTIKGEPLIGHEIGRKIILAPPERLSFINIFEKHKIQTIIDVMVPPTYTVGSGYGGGGGGNSW